LAVLTALRDQRAAQIHDDLEDAQGMALDACVRKSFVVID
jgi:hypothetical protein